MTLLQPNEKLLLTAALQQGPTSRHAWEKWRQSCPLNDDIEDGFHRLIPLLHHNLTAQGVNDQELSRYATIRRFFWYRNQVFIQEAERMLGLFQEAGIQTLVLKGVGLALTVYPKPELRPLSDLDVLVTTSDAPQAIELLKSKGFLLPIQSSAPHLQGFQGLFRSHHAHSFQRPTEPLSIDLHVRLHSPVPSLVLTRRMLAMSRPLNIGKANTSVAQPAEQMFHAILHGTRGSHLSSSTVRWAADAAMIRTAHDADIDWQSLADLGRHYECLSLIHDALDDVAEVMGKPLPTAAISAFRANKPTVLDSLEWTARRWYIFNIGFPFSYFLDFRRFRQADRELGTTPRTFTRFLADRWLLEYESEIPRAFLNKLIRRLLRLAQAPK